MSQDTQEPGTDPIDVPGIRASAEWVREKIRELLTGTKVKKDSKRYTLAACYLDTVMEYHAGITTLVREGMYAPAFALGRPLYEASLRAIWIMECADEKRVEQMWAGAEDVFGPAIELAQEVDARRKGDNSFEHYHRQTWKILNSFTHTGLGQLFRRGFDGAIPQGYSDPAILELLDDSTATLLIFAQRYFYGCGYGPQAFGLKFLDRGYHEDVKHYFVFEAWKRLISQELTAPDGLAC